MSEKKRSAWLAGLPWIAAMAFFMQALDATILNTALTRQSPTVLIVLLRDAVGHHQLYADGGDAYSGKRLAGRSLRYASHFYILPLACLGSLACALLQFATQLVSSGYSGDRRRDDDAGCSAGPARLSP